MSKRRQQVLVLYLADSALDSIVIGWSLYDLDIKRILSGSAELQQKTFFVVGRDADDATIRRAKRYGTVLAENLEVQVQKFNGRAIGVQFPPIVELTVTHTEPGVRGDTASGGVTKPATLETGLEIRVPLFIKEGERVKVHTETREFAGRA